MYIICDWWIHKFGSFILNCVLIHSLIITYNKLCFIEFSNLWTWWYLMCSPEKNSGYSTADAMKIFCLKQLFMRFSNTKNQLGVCRNIHSGAVGASIPCGHYKTPRTSWGIYVGLLGTSVPSGHKNTQNQLGGLLEHAWWSTWGLVFHIINHPEPAGGSVRACTVG